MGDGVENESEEKVYVGFFGNGVVFGERVEREEGRGKTEGRGGTDMVCFKCFIITIMIIIAFFFSIRKKKQRTEIVINLRKKSQEM